jgi:hypothetical protein
VHDQQVFHNAVPQKLVRDEHLLVDLNALKYLQDFPLVYGHAMEVGVSEEG